MNNSHEEEVAEIRNAHLCMAGIMRKYIAKKITIEQAMILIGKELKRQGDCLKMLGKGGI